MVDHGQPWPIEHGRQWSTIADHARIRLGCGRRQRPFCKMRSACHWQTATLLGVGSGFDVGAIESRSTVDLGSVQEHSFGSWTFSLRPEAAVDGRERMAAHPTTEKSK